MATSLWHRSGDTQLRKTVFEPANGASVQFFVGGTSTPLVVFNDADESSPAGSEVSADAQGRWPFLYVPTGNSFDYYIRDTDGTLITSGEDVPNPTVNAAVTPEVGAYETGDTMFLLQSGTRSGWVRLNGRTIGSAASAATERANDDTEDLYEKLWNALTDTIAPVPGGRGASAAADFAANKPFPLVDFRGGSPRGLDDMGNSAANSLANSPFAVGDATTPGSTVGLNSTNLTSSQLPTHTHGVGTLTVDPVADHTHGVGTLATAAAGGVTPTITDPGHLHVWNDYRTTDNVQSGQGAGVVSSQSTQNLNTTSNTTGITVNPIPDHTHTLTGATAAGGGFTATLDGATASAGSGSVLSLVSNDILGTWYIKL